MNYQSKHPTRMNSLIRGRGRRLFREHRRAAAGFLFWRNPKKAGGLFVLIGFARGAPSWRGSRSPALNVGSGCSMSRRKDAAPSQRQRRSASIGIGKRSRTMMRFPKSATGPNFPSLRDGEQDQEKLFRKIHISAPDSPGRSTFLAPELPITTQNLSRKQG